MCVLLGTGMIQTINERNELHAATFEIQKRVNDLMFFVCVTEALSVYGLPTASSPMTTFLQAASRTMKSRFMEPRPASSGVHDKLLWLQHTRVIGESIHAGNVLLFFHELTEVHRSRDVGL